MGHSVGGSEANSWRASLPRPQGAIRLAKLPGDVQVTLEERIPYFSKRIDACLFGHTDQGAPYSVIVELKGWGDAHALDSGNVETVLGGGLRDEPHPSAQVHGYHQQLEDHLRAFQGNDRVGLASCAYCHNYPGIVPDDGLFHPQFDALREGSPTFGERDADLLAKYLNVRLATTRRQQPDHEGGEPGGSASAQASMDCTFEDLLVALVDTLWKGRRDEALEACVVDEAARRACRDRWDLFTDLDDCFERIADGGADRLMRSR